MRPILVTLTLLLCAPALAQDAPAETRESNVKKALVSAKALSKKHWVLRTFVPPVRRSSPGLDLNEVRVKLLRRAGKSILKIGAKQYTTAGELSAATKADHSAFKALRTDLIAFRDGYKGSGEWGVPVILDVAKGTPMNLVEHAVRAIADLWRDASYARAAKKKIVPLRVEADVQLEFDEKLVRGGLKKPGKVEKPIIILEDEVEVVKGVPKGTDMSNLSNKNLDSTSVNDPYGVGGGSSGAYSQRWGKGALAREGGGPNTEKGVVTALRYLKTKQAPNGSWPTTAQAYEPAAAALSLLAYLGNGHTHRFGTFKRSVSRGLQWLKRQQKADGSMGFDPAAEATVVNHLLAGHALAEAYAVSRDFTLKRYTEKALQFTLKRQRADGGWGVEPLSDSLLTALALQQLRASKIAGLRVDSSAVARAQAYLRKLFDAKGRVGFRKAGDSGGHGPLGSMTATSAAVFSHLHSGGKLTPQIKNAARLLVKGLPSKRARKGLDMLHMCLTSHALFQVGGKDWKSSHKVLRDAVLAAQKPDGHWPATGPWGKAAGDVVSTALGTLSLEVYYRLARNKKR
jgi:hypothetical protein